MKVDLSSTARRKEEVGLITSVFYLLGRLGNLEVNCSYIASLRGIGVREQYPGPHRLDSAS